MRRWPTRAGLAPYNLSHYRHFMDPKLRSLRLLRNVHMSSWVAHDVETVESVREDCGPFLMEALAELPNLRAVLAASIDLSPVVLQHPLAEVSEHHVQTVTSDGSATVPIRTAPFDPEAFPYLLLDLALPAGQTGARFLVRSALLDGTVTDVGLHLTATRPVPIKVNLLEAPWLAIQPVLTNVSLVLTYPGEYTIRRLSLLEETPATEHFYSMEPRIRP